MSSGGFFDLEQLRARVEEIDAISQDPEFWNNSEGALGLMKERGDIIDLLGVVEGQSDALEEATMFIEMANEAGGDEQALSEAASLVESARKAIQSMETRRMLGGEHDDLNAIVTIHAGAGGTESQDWASILFRMYLRYFEIKGWTAEITDIQDGDEAGIKSVDIRVSGGEFAYGHLKAEAGVHRLVRISPFDSAKRRHTSFAAVSVYPEVDDNIDIEVNESDLRIDTYRASGAGGQHVNRTDSAVRLTHIPTGIVVACQLERSQHKNKSTAMKLLKSRLYERELKMRQDKASEEHAVQKDVAFGSQIRSYVLHPYKQIKDLRTGQVENNVDKVLDGQLDPFVEAFLLMDGNNKNSGADA